jgi:hypothetical protein
MGWRGVLRYAGGRSRPLQFVNAINKMARTAWALLAHGGTYRAPEPNKGARRGREEEEGYGERHRHDLEGPPRKVRRSGSAKHLCQVDAPADRGLACSEKLGGEVTIDLMSPLQAFDAGSRSGASGRSQPWSRRSHRPRKLDSIWVPSRMPRSTGSDLGLERY